MATQLTRIDERGKTIARLFEENRKRMISLAPRTTGDPTRIFQVCFQAIAYDADLLDCTQESLIGGVFEAIKLGITLGGPMQEGWLIPFKDGGKKKATLIPGYMGLRNIIDRGGSVIDMHPRAVHKNDEFEYWFGDNPRIIHKPKTATPDRQEDLRAVYVVANLRRGGRQMEVLELEEIVAHMKRSRAAQYGRSPWTTDFVAMGLKTAIRKISKYLPKSNELLARALDLDQNADLGKDQNLEVPEGTTLIDEELSGSKMPKSPIDVLKARMGVTQQRPPDIETTTVDPQEDENRRIDRELAEEEARREGRG